jgi:hypothetical protein
MVAQRRVMLLLGGLHGGGEPSAGVLRTPATVRRLSITRGGAACSGGAGGTAGWLEAASRAVSSEKRTERFLTGAWWAWGCSMAALPVWRRPSGSLRLHRDGRAAGEQGERGDAKGTREGWGLSRLSPLMLSH